MTLTNSRGSSVFWLSCHMTTQWLSKSWLRHWLSLTIKNIHCLLFNNNNSSMGNYSKFSLDIFFKLYTLKFKLLQALYYGYSLNIYFLNPKYQ